MTATSVKILFFTCLLSEDHKAERARRTAKARSSFIRGSKVLRSRWLCWQQSLFLSPDGDKEGVTRSWVYSRDPAGHRRITLNHSRSPGQVPLDWSAEEDSGSQGLLPEKIWQGFPTFCQVDCV